MWQQILYLIEVLGPYLFTVLVFAVGAGVLIYAVIMRGKTGRWPWPLEFLNRWGV